MIVEFLMNLLTWVVNLLPEWEPLGIASDYIADLLALPVISDAIGIVMWLDHYLPIAEALDLLALTTVAWAIGWAYSGTMWVWRNLPGKAT